MRPTGNWRPKGFLGPLIGSYLRLADETLPEAYGESMGSSCQTFRGGTTSLARDGVRLTSHLLLLELVGWVESPRQQLAPSMEYHMSVRSRTGWGSP